MSRELILMRHAKTEWDNPQGDIARELTQQGVEEAHATGAWLQSQQVMPAYVCCSSAQRAQQTWEAVTSVTHWHGLAFHTEPRLYLAELVTLQRVLMEIPLTAKQVLLIGHNPGLEHLAVFFSAQSLPRNSVGEILATANVLRFRLPDDWTHVAAKSGVLIDCFRPQSF